MRTIEERIDQMGALTRLIRWMPPGLLAGKNKPDSVHDPESESQEH